MGYKKINFGILVLLTLFVLGILFASSYSSNKTQLATLTLSEKHSPTPEMAQSISEVKGIKTVFLDENSQLLTFRYDNSKLNLNQVKTRLQKQGYQVKQLYSFQILPTSDKNIKNPKEKNLVRFDFSTARESVQ